MIIRISFARLESLDKMDGVEMGMADSTEGEIKIMVAVSTWKSALMVGMGNILTQRLGPKIRRIRWS